MQGHHESHGIYRQAGLSLNCIDLSSSRLRPIWLAAVACSLALTKGCCSRRRRLAAEGLLFTGAEWNVMPPALVAPHPGAHAADAAELAHSSTAQPAPTAKRVASQHSCMLRRGGTQTMVMVSLLRLSITSATLSAADCPPRETWSTRDSALEAAWSAA